MSGNRGKGRKIWLSAKDNMKSYHYDAIKLLISFIIAGSAIFAGTSLLRYFDPTFSIGLFDLLAQINLTAWLLLGLLAGIIYAALSRLPVFPQARKAEDLEAGGDRQLSD